MEGTFKYTNGRDTFKAKFKAQDEPEAHTQVQSMLKRMGCGLVKNSIKLGGKTLKDTGPVFEPHLSPLERMRAEAQNIRGYAYEYCAPDFR